MRLPLQVVRILLRQKRGRGRLALAPSLLAHLGFDFLVVLAHRVFHARDVLVLLADKHVVVDLLRQLVPAFCRNFLDFQQRVVLSYVDFFGAWRLLTGARTRLDGLLLEDSGLL